MTSSLLHDAEHWRQRAQDVAALASSATDPHVRRTLTEIAQGYARLADLADAANGRAAQAHLLGIEPATARDGVNCLPIYLS